MTEENEDRKVEGKIPHAEERANEALQGNPHRQVGDFNRVVREGRQFKDTETGYNVYVKGDRVVIVDLAINKQITQFKNSKTNTQKRILSGKWIPLN